MSRGHVLAGHRRIPLQPGSESDSSSDEEAAAAAHSHASAQHCRLVNAACVWRTECRMVTLEVPEATGDEVHVSAVVAHAEVAEALHAPDGVCGTGDLTQMLDATAARGMRADDDPIGTSVVL